MKTIYSLIILLCLAPNITFAAEAVKLNPIEGGSCGIYVEDADALIPDTQYHPLLAYDGDHSDKMKINLNGKDMILPLQKTGPEGEKVGDPYIRFYSGNGISLSLKLEMAGYCGAQTLADKDEDCEIVTYTGGMDLRTPQGGAHYSVIVNIGC